MAAWARAFLLTQLVEAPLYRFGYGAQLSVALAASTLTHPIVWLVFFGPCEPFASLSYTQRLVLAEAFACLVEALVLRLSSRRPHALAWSLIANGSSLALGSALRAAFDFP